MKCKYIMRKKCVQKAKNSHSAKTSQSVFVRACVRACACVCVRLGVGVGYHPISLIG